jgi:L-asparaginase
MQSRSKTAHRIRIAAIGLGGTISMTDGAQGLIASRPLADLFAGQRLDEAGVDITCFDFGLGASASIGLADLGRIARQIDQCIQDGCASVIIVQGTDTLEETAFAFELLCQAGAPIVVTGAMRSGSQAGSDGPANLAGGIAVCRSGATVPGVYVVMNDEVHAARYVRKTHTTSVSAFSSGEMGLLGRIHEGAFRSHHRSLSPLARYHAPAVWPRVAVVPIVLGDDGMLIEAAAHAGVEGCVLDAMGAGHVPETLIPQIERLAANMPVILCSRTGEGAVCERTYGYPGSETDLIRRGVIPGGALHSLKARLLLALCLSQPGEDPRALFAAQADLI